MAAFLEICRAYPIAFFLLILGPFIGAVITAASGYEGLKARLSTDQQAARIETTVRDLAPPAETIRRYEALLGAQGQRSEAMSQIIIRYDRLKSLVGLSLTGKADTADRLGTAERAIADLQGALQSVTIVSLLGHDALVVRIAANTFRVTFNGPLPATPRLTFSDLPPSAVATVLEPSKFGFTVVFTPSDIAVQHFGITADVAP